MEVLCRHTCKELAVANRYADKSAVILRLLSTGTATRKTATRKACGRNYGDVFEIRNRRSTAEQYTRANFMKNYKCPNVNVNKHIAVNVFVHA